MRAQKKRQLLKDIKRGRKAKEEEIESFTRTYEQNVAAMKSFKPGFGELHGGIGLTSQLAKRAVEQWERKRCLLISLKMPEVSPQSKRSPVKICGN